MIDRLPTTFYTLRRIKEMLGLDRGAVAALVNAGFVSPARGPRNEYRFSFQDVVLLRTANHLIRSHIPQRKMLRALQQLRAKLPRELPLTGLRIKAIGNDVAVRDGNAPWEASSGQMLMDFEVAAVAGSVTFFERGTADGGMQPLSGDAWFQRGQSLESRDAKAAEQAYLRAIEAAPDAPHAYVNLGALLCEDGRCDDAVALYDGAVMRIPASAELHFNRAIALEDGGRDRDALASYQRCLELDPDCADAHFNAARLSESLGEFQSAVRHYNAYRRMT